MHVLSRSRSEFASSEPQEIGRKSDIAPIHLPISESLSRIPSSIADGTLRLLSRRLQSTQLEKSCPVLALPLSAGSSLPVPTHSSSCVPCNVDWVPLPSLL